MMMPRANTSTALVQASPAQARCQEAHKPEHAPAHFSSHNTACHYTCYHLRSLQGMPKRSEDLQGLVLSRLSGTHHPCPACTCVLRAAWAEMLQCDSC